MLKTAARLFGFAFVLVGVLGFVPGVTDEHQMLLGIFHVNFAHNLVHLLTGLVALIAAAAGPSAPRTFFRVFGVAYGLIAVLGLMAGDTPILGLISNNMADTWLHAAVAIGSLALGFSSKTTPPMTHAHQTT